MIYDHLGQTTTMTTTAPSSGFRSFFRPLTRFFFPNFFPVYNLPPPQPACIPVPVPAGTLGRDSNGNLTLNGQTYCRPGASYAPAYNAPLIVPAVPRFRVF
jgi:hypothetical protein